MSHTSKIKTDLTFNERMKQVLNSACKKLGLELKPWGKHKLYSSTEEGFAVKLPGWHYPIVLNEAGIAKDDYNGHWGKPAELEKFMRRVVAEKTIVEARRKGYIVNEVEKDGEIRLTLTGGACDA